MTEFLHIVVTREIYDKLRKRGKMGDSFNDVITKLLREVR